MSSTEDADYHDKGINEVLQLTDDLKLGTEVDENSEKGQGDKDGQKESFVETNGSDRTGVNEEAAPDVDLADPERVLQMLETVDLSEEDTEFLLQEAYKMNKKLKEMLRHQEKESSSCPPDIQRQKSKLKREKGSTASGARSESGNFSAAKPLPPILGDRKSTDIYAVKLRRSRTNIPITNSQPTVVAERSKSSKAPSRNDSRTSQSKKKTKASEEKPDWNARFNYT